MLQSALDRNFIPGEVEALLGFRVCWDSLSTVFFIFFFIVIVNAKAQDT